MPSYATVIPISYPVSYSMIAPSPVYARDVSILGDLTRDITTMGL